MTSPMGRRGGHRKRISGLRLSSDSTVPALPLYTSPPWQRPVEILQDPSDLPPDYPDSAEEGDADTDTDEGAGVVYAPTSPPLTFSPRRSSIAARRPQLSSSSRISRRHTSASASASDTYLDSLLERSVHALEMSNTLLQSSMSTRSALTSVLTKDSPADLSLESHARNLSSRIMDKSPAWMEDLDQISKGVEGLFAEEDRRSLKARLGEDTTSQSLPVTSPLSTVPDRVQRSHLRRPSLDLRDASSSSTLQFSNHDRKDLIAPPPRAVTMYVDTTHDPSSITLPPTLGLRSSTRLPPTLLPSQPGFQPTLQVSPPAPSENDPPKRAVDILSSFATPPRATSTAATSRAVSPSSIRQPRRSNSTSTNATVRKRPRSTSQGSEPSDSASHSPCRTARRTWDTPVITELPSDRSSASSETLNVDRTLSSLRTILEQHPPPEPPQPKEKSIPKPLLLKPPTVAPVADTSTATASISRLFTKARHTSSTRPPSPPPHSSLKGKSGRSAPPTPTSPALSLSGSWLSIPDAFGIGGSSGRSTPSRVSFAELPDTGRDKSKPSSVKTRSRSRSRKKKGINKAGTDSDSSEGGKWWLWLLSAGAANGSPAALHRGPGQDERVGRPGGWGSRPGFSNGIEDWGV